MSQGRVVPVNLPAASYDITIEPGLLNRAGEVISAILPGLKICILTDSDLEKHHLQTLARSFKTANVEPIVHVMPAGEQNKNLEQVGKIYDTFLRARIDRSTALVALGGGVVGDVAGFVAATILRGVPFVQVPTSLLAMVDASVGGKTGIDHAVGKNLIGAFHQPRAVLIDPEVLKTLPPRQLRSGLAECIKHDIIRDGAGFADLEKNISRALALDMEYLGDLIAHNVSIKAKVVAADPFEKGERAHLNFGHTFGHAIESVSNFAYSHGESIALGMCAASHCAMKLGMIDAASKDRIVRLFQSAELPTSGMKLDVSKVTQAMYFDKKVAGTKMRLVLPDRIGHVVIRDDVSEDVIRQSLMAVQ